MVARMRKREASRIRWRGAGTVCALGYIGIGVFSLLAALHFLREPDLTALVLSLLVPVTFGATAMGVGSVVYLFLRWNGRPETVLLLRLIEESETHDNYRPAATDPRR